MARQGGKQVDPGPPVRQRRSAADLLAACPLARAGLVYSQVLDAEVQDPAPVVVIEKRPAGAGRQVPGEQVRISLAPVSDRQPGRNVPPGGRVCQRVVKRRSERFGTKPAAQLERWRRAGLLPANTRDWPGPGPGLGVPAVPGDRGDRRGACPVR
jgi:hypothetical protein